MDYVAMAESQSTDPQIRALQSSPQSPLVVEAFSLANSSHPVYCDISTGTQRPLVPKAWRWNSNCLKEDISSTAAELVHGTTFRLPGEYFTPTTIESLLDQSNNVRQLKALMQCIHSSPPRQTH